MTQAQAATAGTVSKRWKKQQGRTDDRIAALEWVIAAELISEANGATAQRDDNGKVIEDLATCGTCGMTWNDALITERTPVPSAHCPYEYIHEEIAELARCKRSQARSRARKAERLEYLRGELRAKRISYGEIAELQSLAEFIEPGDVELLEAAGVPEEPLSDGEDSSEAAIQAIGFGYEPKLIEVAADVFAAMQRDSRRAALLPEVVEYLSLIAESGIRGISPAVVEFGARALLAKLKAVGVVAAAGKVSHD